jgi:hypothetical protein
MHSAVRTRIQRNADYHAAVAEHYTSLQKKATNGNGEGHPNPDAPPPPPVETGSGRRRGSAPVAVPANHTGPSSEDLAKLIETHTEAAAQLNALLVNDRQQSIIKERAKPAVTRQTGTIRSDLARSLRTH